MGIVIPYQLVLFRHSDDGFDQIVATFQQYLDERTFVHGGQKVKIRVVQGNSFRDPLGRIIMTFLNLDLKGDIEQSAASIGPPPIPERLGKLQLQLSELEGNEVLRLYAVQGDSLLGGRALVEVIQFIQRRRLGRLTPEAESFLQQFDSEQGTIPADTAKAYIPPDLLKKMIDDLPEGERIWWNRVQQAQKIGVTQWAHETHRSRSEYYYWRKKFIKRGMLPESEKKQKL